VNWYIPYTFRTSVRPGWIVLAERAVQRAVAEGAVCELRLEQSLLIN